MTDQPTDPTRPAPVPVPGQSAAQAGSQARSQVLALVDDARAARVLLDISSVLAQLMQRELQVVYLEDVAALAAAALPATRVLAAASGRWAPLAPLDVAQGFAQEADRLRALAEQAALHRAVQWSMRVMRGGLPDTARSLMRQSDLLLVAGGLARFSLPDAPLRCRAVTALDDGTAAGAQALQIATRLTAALGAQLRRQPVIAGSAWTLSGPADLLVLPQALQPALARQRTVRPATLLVGPAGTGLPGD